MNSSPSTPASGYDRRTFLRIGAWAVPALAVSGALAAPPAWAGTPKTVNLALQGPQFGSSIPLFTPALTQRFDASEPAGTVIANTGTTAYTGSIVLTLEVDSRLWKVTGFTYDTRTSAGAKAATFSGPTISGNRATYTATFTATIAPGTDPFTGVLVRPKASFLGAYPNDTFALADTAYTWKLRTPNDDADTSDNVWKITAGAPVSAAPFGGALTATFAKVASGSGSAYRPTSATLTSIGPKPIAAGDGIRVSFDAAVGGGVQPKSVTLNGTAASTLLTVAENTVSGGRRSVLLKLAKPLAAGDKVAFTLSYSAGTGGTPGAAAQIGYWPVSANSADQRGMNVSYVDQPSS
ncbi:MAG: hypothetical protein PIR02_07170 [Microbacterium enclense]